MVDPRPKSDAVKVILASEIPSHTYEREWLQQDDKISPHLHFLHRRCPRDFNMTPCTEFWNGILGQIVVKVEVITPLRKCREAFVRELTRFEKMSG
jgi:hypothetical protein